LPRISELNPAAALTGTELVPLDQSGQTLAAQINQIITLAQASLVLPSVPVSAAMQPVFQALTLALGRTAMAVAGLADNNTLTGTQTFQGKVTLSGASLNEAFAVLASAATVNIGAAAANYIQITGVVAITAFDNVQAGVERTLEFAGALTLTNNAAILLLGAANITTVAGDVAVFRSEGAGVWRCVSYARMSTLPTTKALMQTGTDNQTIVTPARVNDADGVAKAWVNFTMGGAGATVNKSFNVTSVTRNGAGDYTVNFTTAMADASFAAVALLWGTTANFFGSVAAVSTKAVGSVRVVALNTTAGSLSDLTNSNIDLVCYGRQ